MTVKDLYEITAENFIFINDDGVKVEFIGQSEYANRKIIHFVATSYPMYGIVLEVEIE